MRVFLLSLFIILVGTLHAQFKGAYYGLHEGDTIEFYKFHSDGDYLKESMDFKIFAMDFYFSLNDLEGDDHIWQINYNDSLRPTNDNNTLDEDGAAMYTRFKLAEFFKLSQKQERKLKSYKDTLGYDLVKINQMDTAHRISCKFKDTDFKIIGIMLFGNRQPITVPEHVKIQGSDGENMVLKLLDFNRTSEEVLVPNERKLGKFIEFERFSAMMQLGGFGRE
jgi:hypothetical protein